MKKRCAWYPRVKLKLHKELPYAEGEEFLEVMSLDRGAGVRPVEEGGSSSSSGPAVMSEDVKENAPMKKLVAPSAPTADDRERTHSQWACSVQDLVSRVLHRAGGRETATQAIAIDYGYLNERDDQLPETAGVPNLG